MGMGGRNPAFRAVRLGALVLVVLAGVVFHHSGGAYNAIHFLYIALVIGFLAVSISTRRRRAGAPVQGGAAGSWGDAGQPIVTRDISTAPTLSTPPLSAEALEQVADPEVTRPDLNTD
jgi:hypothetical protein